MADESIGELYMKQATDLSRMYIVVHAGYVQYSDKLANAQTHSEKLMYARICDSGSALLDLILKRIDELNNYNSIEDPRNDQAA